MQFRVSPKSVSECSAEEWQARVDLAAAHRLAHMHGFSEGIFNHLTLVVPGRMERVDAGQIAKQCERRDAAGKPGEHCRNGATAAMDAQRK